MKKRPAYNSLKLLEMTTKDYRKNRAALRAYLDRSTALRAEPAPVKAKKSKQ